MGERDWSVFLAEKLAAPWTADRVSTTLNPDVLKQVEKKWSVIEPPVKLRVLLAVLGVKRTGSAEQAALFEAFGSLQKVAARDQDEWVSLTAQITGSITEEGFSEEGGQHPAFTELREELRGLLRG